MSSRDIILARVRDALGPSVEAPQIPRTYRQSGDLDPAAVVDLFMERVDDYRAMVHRVADAEALPRRITEIVESAGRGRVVVPPGLESGWTDELPPDVEVIRDDPPLTTAELDQADLVITSAALGIAETGTIILDASADQGRRALTLVPDHHVCVVPVGQIFQTVPEALARLEPRRPLTLISGPSATSDIELARVEGVHGPRTLDVIVTD